MGGRILIPATSRETAKEKTRRGKRNSLRALEGQLAISNNWQMQAPM